jgi:glycosyltransferase involved in cell wall biosynthesis
MPPYVSIILPTYNRASFLPRAFESIRNQEFSDWELIVVDDGSIDNSAAMIDELRSHFSQPVKYVYQDNQGAAGARNTGLILAVGKYIAFFDSDDEWLPHHLKRCVHALETNPEVDWVYGACRIVDERTRCISEESTFYSGGLPRPFLSLSAQCSGELLVIEDSLALETAISVGLMCGLQCSVLRAQTLQFVRIPPFRIGEDQVLSILFLLRGSKLAYFNDIHAIYYVHDDNTAVVRAALDPVKATSVLRELICALESLTNTPELPLRGSNALRKRLNNEYFWHLGYASLWNHGRQKEAFAAYRSGLRYWPWDWRCWKTYGTSALKYWCSHLISIGALRSRLAL